MLNYIKNLWAKFEAKVASVLPGLKTMILNGAAAVGSFATLALSYFQSTPLDHWIKASTIAIIMAVLSTLSFWLTNLTNRVQARA
jgi:hypothetical protein